MHTILLADHQHQYLLPHKMTRLYDPLAHQQFAAVVGCRIPQIYYCGGLSHEYQPNGLFLVVPKFISHKGIPLKHSYLHLCTEIRPLIVEI